MRHVFDIDGTEHLVWLAPGKGSYRLDLDGAQTPAALESLGEDRYRLTLGATETEVTLVVDGDSVHVAMEGASHLVRYHDNTVHFGEEVGGASEDVARAPMPGSVVAVKVAPGQSIATGDELIIIESMKLETTIRAWRDGVIETIHAAQGQSFDRDAPLITLLPREADAHA